MTRARHTLAIFNRMDRRNPLAADLGGPCFATRRESPVYIPVGARDRDYVLLGLEDLFLDFAGRQDAAHPIHAALNAMQPGDHLTIRSHGDRPTLLSPQGVAVAPLSANAAHAWRDRLSQIRQIRVVCMVTRQRADCKESEYQSLLRVDAWEVPLCELIVECAAPLSASCEKVHKHPR
jgi:ATP-dependent DNA helicase RecQ